MAEVRAFQGVRYEPSRVGSIADVVCAPYDVITPSAQAECYARSEHNAVRLELGRDEPGDGADRNRYTRAAEYLQTWLREGVLRRDEAPSLYVYEESFGVDGQTRRRRGLFAVVRLEEWERRVVLPHERTMPRPRADRLNLLRACRANLSPILSLCEDPSGHIAGLLDAATCQAPVVEFRLSPGAVAAAATGHRLWRLSEPRAAESIARDLSERPLYIADGHHRYETALEYWREVKATGAGLDHPAAWVLMLLADVADPGLLVLPTHRLVRLSGLRRSGLLERLAGLFSVQRLDGGPGERLTDLLDEMARRSGAAPAFGVAGLEPGVLHLLTAEPSASFDTWLPRDRSPAWRRLDVTVLHGVILQGLLGLAGEEPGDGGRLAYTRDPAAALSAVSSGEYDLAFFLNPTRVEQIREVAQAGDRMPEKSTYFWPKPPAGVVFYAH